MRKLQKDLREQVKINISRKQRLLKVIEGQLQYEQYKQILDGLDGQVEHSYFKRYVSVPPLRFSYYFASLTAIILIATISKIQKESRTSATQNCSIR
jgi:Histone acetyltransferases subunit 3